MLEDFISYLQTLDPDYPNKKILLAVSGGIDSMVLMNLSKRAKLNFAVAHCNFKLRAKDSDKDESLVISEAIKSEAPMFLIQFETKKILKEQSSQSTQMLARNLRYKWFNDLCHLHEYDYIVTAHHLNDSIETFIYNFSQGTGIKGLTGIPSLNENILRPLGLFNKEEIKEYASLNKIAFREDASNAKNDYKRNQIRNKILPLLLELNPSFIKNAGKSLHNLKEARIIYENRIDNLKAKLIKNQGDQNIINVLELKKEKAPTTLLFEFLSPYGFSFDTVESIIQIGNNGSGQYFYSTNYQLLFDRSNLIIQKKDHSKIDSQSFKVTDSLVEFNKNQYKINVEVRTSDFVIEKDKSVACLDLDSLKPTLEIRTWLPGDRFQPIGMKGQHQKLQDFFSNEGLSRIEKDLVPIFLSDDEICWVAGYRIDERFKVTEKTKNVLIIRPAVI